MDHTEDFHHSLETQLKICNEKKSISNFTPSAEASIINDLLKVVWSGQHSGLAEQYEKAQSQNNPHISSLFKPPLVLLTTLANLAIHRHNYSAIEELLSIREPNIQELISMNQLQGLEIWQSSDPKIWSLFLEAGYGSAQDGVVLSSALSYILQPGLCRANNNEIASLLLKHGAKPDILCLIKAVKTQDITLMNTLWAYLPENALEGSRILHEAIAVDKPESAKWLVQVANMNVNVIPTDGWRLNVEERGEAVGDDMSGTPLHCSVVFNRVGMLRMLLKEGADTSVENASGLTPYQIAKKRGLWTAVALLKFA